MSAQQGGQPPPLRVEQALRLLPEVDILAPLRGYLISSSRAKAALDPHGTVGKRLVQPSDLRDFIPQAIESQGKNLRALYEACVEALEAEQAGDIPGVVRALLPAGQREEATGRYAQAREWYDCALRVAEGLRDRRPEIETLRHLGRLELARGDLEDAARLFQRSYYLAVDELDNTGVALACEGLGDIARVQARWQGAESWYKRGLSHTKDEPLREAELHLGLGEVERSRGHLEVAAERFTRARTLFEQVQNADGIVKVLNAWGQLEADLGRTTEAVASWREALAELHRAGDDARLETAIRLNMCRLYLDTNRLTDAEDEVRKAEELAIEHNFTGQLARLYVVMGKLRGRQQDETGFVFFEKAVELCEGAVPDRRLQAEVYRDYAQFRNEFGDREEAVAYLSRAREILESSGDEAGLVKIESELESMRS